MRGGLAGDPMEMLLMRQRCHGCGNGVAVWSDECPRCGLVLHSARRLRAAGVLYLVLGLVLTIAAVGLMALIIVHIVRADDPELKDRLAEGAWVLLMAFGALGFVLVLGVTGILMGVWQIRDGRRNPKLVRVVIILYLIFMACAGLVWALR